MSQYWLGSRDRLRALEALAFLILKYAFSTFPGTFSSNYFMYLCVGKLQNIYFNMKDSEYFGKCNFPFLCLRQSRVLVVLYFCLQIHYSVSQGSGAHLGLQKLSHF